MKKSQAAVRSLLLKYGTADPYTLAKERDIMIFHVAMPNGTLGQTVRSRRQCTVFIEESLSDALDLYVSSHEVGHCEMHPGFNTPYMRGNMNGYDIPVIEREANEFACSLLVNYYGFDASFNSLDFIKSLGLPENMTRFLLPEAFKLWN